MINSTNVKVPKKYEHMIEEIYHDSDGYWAHSAKGFEFEEMGCHTAHEYTQKDLMDMIRTLQTCQCSECKEVEMVEVEEIKVDEPVETVEKYVVIDLERSIKAGQMFYWRANGCSYTSSIWEAGEYTKEDATELVNSNFDRRTVSISLYEVEKILR